MRLWKPGRWLVVRFIDNLLPNIADALEEEQREDVALEVRCTHQTTQNVGRASEDTVLTGGATPIW